MIYADDAAPGMAIGPPTTEPAPPEYGKDSLGVRFPAFSGVGAQRTQETAFPVQPPQVLKTPTVFPAGDHLHPLINPALDYPNASTAATLDFEGFMKGLDPAAQESINSQLTRSPDRNAAVAKIQDRIFLSERTGFPLDFVSANFDQVRTAYGAHSNIPQDTYRDAGKFHGFVMAQAQADSAENVMLFGLKANSKDGEISREKSLYDMAYGAAALNVTGDTSGKRKHDAFDAFVSWEQMNEKHPGYRKESHEKYMRLYLGAYEKGRMDNEAADDALRRVMPVLKGTSGEARATGGETGFDAAADIMMGLSPAQQHMVFNRIASGAAVPGKEKVGLGGGGSDLSTSLERGVVDLATSASNYAAKIGKSGDTRADIVDRQNLRAKLVDATLGKIDPIDPKNVATYSANLAARSAPSMALAAIPWVGPTLLAAGYISDSENKYAAAGVPRDKAMILSTVTGPLQAGVDMLEVSVLKQGLGAVFQRLSGKALPAFVMRTVGMTAAETAQELIQDPLIPAFVQDVGHWWDSKIPGVKWADVSREAWAQTPDTILTMLPMALIGAGFAHAGDVKNASAVVRNEEALRRLGYSPDAIKRVQAANDDRAVDVFRQEWAGRTPILKGDKGSMDISEAIGHVAESLAHEAEAAKGRASQVGPAGPTSPETAGGSEVADTRARETVEGAPATPEPEAFPLHRDDQGWYLMDGETRIDGGSFDVAKYMQETLLLHDSAEAAQGHVSAIDQYQRDNPGVEQIVSGNAGQFSKNATGGIDILTTTPQGKAKVEEFDTGMMDQLHNQVGDFTGGSINGRNWVENGIRKIQQNQSAQGVLTTLHEQLESGWNAGRISKAEKVEVAKLILPLYQKAIAGTKHSARDAETARIFRDFIDGKNNEDEFREAFTDVALGNETSKRKDGSSFKPGVITIGIKDAIRRLNHSGTSVEKSAAQKVRAFLQIVRDYMRAIFSAGAKIRKAKSEGESLELLDATIDKLMGRDGETKSAMASAEAAGKMAEKASGESFSISGHEVIPLRHDKPFTDGGEVIKENYTIMTPGMETTLTVPPGTSEADLQARARTKIRNFTYTKAVEAGDIETAQRMVDEAAKRAGYTIGPVLHGTKSKFEGFKKSSIRSRHDYSFGFHFTTRENEAYNYATDTERAHTRIRKGGPMDLREGEAVIRAYVKIENPLEITTNYNAASMEADNHKSRIVGQLTEAAEAGNPYDGVIIDRKRDDEWDHQNVIVFDPNQIKSADTITYDAKGRVIPLEERFNPEDNRISHSVSPHSSLDILSAAIERRLAKNPEARLQMSEQAKANLEKLRGSYDEAGRAMEDLEVRQEFEMGAAREEKWSKARRDELAERHKREMDALDTAESRKALTRDLQTLNAIMAALPAEIRSKIGGFITLSKLATPEARTKEIVKRVDKAGDVVEKYLKNEYETAITKLADKAGPSREAGDKPKGKLGAEGHALVDAVQENIALSKAEAQAKVDSLISAIAKETDPEKQVDLAEELNLALRFGALGEQETNTAANLADSYKWLKENIDRERSKWRVQEEARLAEVKRLQAGTVDSIGAADLADVTDVQGKKKHGMSTIRASVVSIPGGLRALFGEHAEVTKRWRRKLREGINAFLDDSAAMEKEFNDMLRTHFGAGTPGRKAFYKLMETSKETGITITPGGALKTVTIPAETARKILDGGAASLAKAYSKTGLESMRKALEENDARGSEGSSRQKPLKEISFKQPSGGKEKPLNISQAKAIQLSLAWAQEQGRTPMEAHGFTDKSMEQVESFLSPQAKAFREWIREHYKGEHAGLNEVFSRMQGVALPQIPNYAPLAFKAEGKTDSGGVDPFSGPMMDAGGMGVGMLKTRVERHTAQPEIKDAFSVFFRHMKQTSYFRNMAETVREMRNVLGSVDVQNAVLAKHGEKGTGLVSNMLKILDAGGSIAKSGIGDEWVNKISSARAVASLSLNPATVLKNSAAIMNLAYRMPAGEFSKGLVKLGTGNLGWKKMIDSPTIQRRLFAGAGPEMQLALAGLKGTSPSRLKDLMQKGLMPIAWMDAYTTAGSAAIAFDYYKRTIREESPGMSDAEVEREATAQLEETLGDVAQPISFLDKSVHELQRGALARLIFMFQSEPRQKVALQIEAGAEGDRATLLRGIAINAMVGVAMQAIAAMWRDMRDDDDDELFDAQHWNLKDFAIAAVLGPWTALPSFAGPILETVINKVKGVAFDNSLASDASKITQSARSIYSTLTKEDASGELKSKEPVEKVLHAAEALTQAASVLIGAGEYGAAARVAGYFFDVADNLHDDEVEAEGKERRKERREAKEAEEE